MIHKITKLIINFQKIPKRKRNRTFMELSGYPHYENVCSNILSFYFDTNNEHNLKDLFLKSLLKSYKLEIDNDYLLQSITVEREISTINNNRLDLLLETNQYIIGIENKIYYTLNNDLKDYSKTIEQKANIANKKPIKIVLSLNKIESNKLSENGFINITYSEFFENIQNELGKYILSGQNEYLVYLKGFINTINNLIGNNMENKELNLFFENNSEIIVELISEFNKYQNEIYSKIYQLESIIQKDKFAPNAVKQWIYNKRCLVHDYTISGNQISIDTYVSINGWEIQLFARNNKSRNFLFQEMLKEPDFLDKPIENFKIENNRLIFAKFEVSNIEDTAKSLIDLLKRIEKYIKHHTTKNIVHLADSAKTKDESNK